MQEFLLLTLFLVLGYLILSNGDRIATIFDSVIGIWQDALNALAG